LHRADKAKTDRYNLLRHSSRAGLLPCHGATVKVSARLPILGSRLNSLRITVYMP
jgi:hypothetical protein